MRIVNIHNYDGKSGSLDDRKLGSVSFEGFNYLVGGSGAEVTGVAYRIMSSNISLDTAVVAEVKSKTLLDRLNTKYVTDLKKRDLSSKKLLLNR